MSTSLKSGTGADQFHQPVCANGGKDAILFHEHERIQDLAYIDL